jgi:hypothetical protein
MPYYRFLISVKKQKDKKVAFDKVQAKKVKELEQKKKYSNK